MHICVSEVLHQGLQPSCLPQTPASSQLLVDVGSCKCCWLVTIDKTVCTALILLMSGCLMQCLALLWDYTSDQEQAVMT